MPMKNGNIDAEKLANFASRVLQKVGIPEDDSLITAQKLVQTDLRGIESHGVAHLGPFYVRRIRAGLINPKPNIKIISQTPTTAVIDGDRGLGFVVGHKAMLEAMNKAATSNTGFVSVRHSTHCGAGSVYSLMALSRDMIGISMTTGGVGIEVPGSRGAGAGLNVISIAAPAAEEPPFVLDMAASVVAAGKIEIALRAHKAIPQGWAVDGKGNSITDPRKYYSDKGAVLPLGGSTLLGSYKGFGLSVAIEILCSLLSGALPIPRMVGRPDYEGSANHFFGALRIESFTPLAEFKKNMDEMIHTYRSLPKAPGVARITLAGEPERDLEKERLKNGIPFHPAVIASLQKLSQELNVEYDL